MPGATDSIAGARTSSVTARVVSPLPFVVLVMATVPAWVPTANASAAAFKATVTVAVAPTASVPEAGVTSKKAWSPIAVKPNGTPPVFSSV